jgi:hypothetical protein
MVHLNRLIVLLLPRSLDRFQRGLVSLTAIEDYNEVSI